MAIEIVQYQTHDKKIFSRLSYAQNHEKDLLCNKVEKLIEKYFPVGHKPSTFKVVDAMTSSEVELRQELEDLLSLLESMDSTDADNSI